MKERLPQICYDGLEIPFTEKGSVTRVGIF